MGGACVSFGPGQVPADQFDYNEAILRSAQEQMLLNLVRMRFFEMPQFLAVSSVLTQYQFTGVVGVLGTQRLSPTQPPIPGVGSFITGRADVGYAERPTITYLPVEGQDFARRMLRPIPVDLIFAAAQSGWPADMLIRIGVQRINDVETISHGGVPAPGDIERRQLMARDIERLKAFEELVELMLQVSIRGLIEVQQRGDDKDPQRVLVIAEPRDTEDRRLVDAFRAKLALDPRYRTFRLTDRLTGRDADEITVKTRPLLGMMGFVARGVEVPKRIRDAGWVVPWEDIVESFEQATGTQLTFPFRVRSSDSPPIDPFVGVRSHGAWFHIDNTDIDSKRAFILLMTLFRLLAPEAQGAAPALTLPTGP
jgi:hypothetical protein